MEQGGYSLTPEGLLMSSDNNHAHRVCHDAPDLSMSTPSADHVRRRITSLLLQYRLSTDYERSHVDEQYSCGDLIHSH